MLSSHPDYPELQLKPTAICQPNAIRLKPQPKFIGNRPRFNQ